MIIAIMRNAASAVPLKVAQTVGKHFALTVPENVTAGVDLAVKVALQGIVNVNMMGARGKTVMTVVMVKKMISNTVVLARHHFALAAGF